MIARLRQKIREGGLVGVWMSLISRLPGVDYFIIWSVFRLPLDADFDADEGAELQISFHKSPEALAALLKVRDKRGRFTARLARGNSVALAQNEGVPIGYVWLQTEPDPVEERYGIRIQINDTDIYDFDSFVLGEYRGRGVLRVLHREIARHYSSAVGKTHLAAIIEAPNRRSMRAYQYMGFRKQEGYCLFRVFGRTASFRLP